MIPLTQVMQEQIKTLKKIFDRRKDAPDDMMTKSVLVEYNSPLSVFTHAINSLYYYTSCKFDTSLDVEYIDHFEDSTGHIYTQIVENYQKAVDFINEKIENNEFTTEQFQSKLPYLVMHTVQHIGQGVRLHKMNIQSSQNA